MNEHSRIPEEVQASNWQRAQALSLSVDTLLPSALELLRFLERVDRYRCLYRGPAVSRAIQRYEECWLPLLAEYGSSSTGSTPLQPPLDCAWIWHCHRLNPIAYARHCQLLYGRILGAPPTIDTPEVVECSRTLWEERFPHEMYHLDLTHFHHLDQRQPSPPSSWASRIEYDLEEAAMRQSTFYYQVSESHMKEESFLRAAEQRYKGFLHLFKLTELKLFLVPTYDIDLMWHAHQRNPEAYSQDTTRILGKVLEHDDTSSDRSPGQKLHKGFWHTCQQWQKCYGAAYQRAGVMYRGEPPASVELSLSSSDPNKPTITAVGIPFDFTLLVPRELMQVFITVVKARNVPNRRGEFRIRLQMERKCSSFKLETASIPLLCELVWDHTWKFEVEKSTNRLRLQLLRKRANMLKQKIVGSEVHGEAYIAWQDLLSSPTLSYDGWLPMSSISVPNSGSVDDKPPTLFVSISLTPPRPAPQLFRTINAVPTDDFRCMFEGTPENGCWLTKSVLDHTNRVVFIIRARYSNGYNLMPEDERCFHIHQGEWEYANRYTCRGTVPAKIVASAKQVITERDTQAILSMQRCWGFFDNTSQLRVSRAMADPMWNIRPLLETHGSLSNQIRLVCGRKLEYEVKGTTEEDEGGFVTLIRYNLTDAPLGKATALFNWKTGAMEVSPNESIILVLLLSNIISTSVHDMEGVNVKRKWCSRLPMRQAASPDEWGAIVLTRDGSSSALSRRDSMIPYYCWWGMSPVIWAASFYGPGNALLWPSGCGAGGCGAGGCGGGACGGAGGCGGGGCGGGGCGGGCGG